MQSKRLPLLWRVVIVGQLVLYLFGLSTVSLFLSSNGSLIASGMEKKTPFLTQYIPLKGEKGDQGFAGEVKIVHETTPTPPPKDGKDGKNGENGQNAYELWLKAGNTGTEADFLASLKGKDGETINGEAGLTPEFTCDAATGEIRWRYVGNRLWTTLSINNICPVE